MEIPGRNDRDLSTDTGGGYGDENIEGSMGFDAVYL